MQITERELQLVGLDMKHKLRYFSPGPMSHVTIRDELTERYMLPSEGEAWLPVDDTVHKWAFPTNVRQYMQDVVTFLTMPKKEFIKAVEQGAFPTVGIVYARIIANIPVEKLNDAAKIMLGGGKHIEVLKEDPKRLALLMEYCDD